MKNVTITLPEDVARWARVRAAEQDTSVSRFLRDMLTEKMLQEEAYQASMERFLSTAPAALRKKGAALPSRDELHAR